MTELMKNLRNADRNDYGKALKAVLDALGLSRKDAAELCGCSYNAMVQWINGAKYPSRTRNHIWEVLTSLVDADVEEKPLDMPTTEETWNTVMWLTRLGYSEREILYGEGDLEKLLQRHTLLSFYDKYKAWLVNNFLPGEIVLIPDGRKGFVTKSTETTSWVFIPESRTEVDMDKSCLKKTGELLKL